MSLYEKRNTPDYKQSKLVQVCALIPEYHREYPEAHITVKHVDFTGNRILFDYKDEKHFTGLHGDIEMDLDAFIDLLESLVCKEKDKETVKPKIDLVKHYDIIMTTIEFLKAQIVVGQRKVVHDYLTWLYSEYQIDQYSKDLISKEAFK